MGTKRFEVIMAGVGGRGVLMAGELLARAALSVYPYASWLPSYTAAMRGGPCECTVILSEEEIASPIVSKVASVVVMEPTQLKSFLGRLKPGGLLIVEISGLEEKVDRDDVTVLKVPALAIADRVGNPQAANLVLLAAYIEATKAIPLGLVEAELEKRLGANEKVKAINRAALREGTKLAASSVSQP